MDSHGVSADADSPPSGPSEAEAAAFRACRAGDAIGLAALSKSSLPKGAFTSPSGETTSLAHEVAIKGHSGLISYLVSCNCDLDVLNSNCRTALLEACRSGHQATACAFVKGGANVAATDKSSATALHYASRKGHSILVGELLKAGADIHAVSSRGATALHEAAIAGRDGLVSQLVAAGADVNAVDKDGNTPLHRAVKHPAVVAALLGEGADGGVRNGERAVPMHLAVMRGVPDTVRALAAAAPHTAEGRDRVGMRPLHVAVHYDRGDICAFLLQHCEVEVSPRRVDNNQTPLHTAASVGYAECVELLLEAGASVQDTDEGGATPLHLAARKEHASAVEILLQAGAAVDTKDNKGVTPADIVLQRRAIFGPDIVTTVVKRARAARGEKGADTPRSPIAVQPLQKDIDAVRVCVPRGWEGGVAAGLVVLDGVLSLADFWSDVAVTVEFFGSGDLWWGVLAALILVVSWCSTMTTVWLSNSRVYSWREQALRLGLGSIGAFPLGLSLGLKVVGKAEFVLFEQLRMLEVFVESIPELLLQTYVLVTTVSRAAGDTSEITVVQLLSLTLSLLAVANAVFDSRRKDIISLSVPGLMEDLVARPVWGIVVRWSVLLMTVAEVTCAILLFSTFASVFNLYIFVMLGWSVSMVWLYTAWRYRALTAFRNKNSWNDGVDARLIFLYYAGLAVVSGAGFVHGRGAARSDQLRHQALNLRLFGCKEHDRLLLTAGWKSLWFLASILIATLLITRCDAPELHVCTSPGWDRLAWSCFAITFFVHIVYAGLLLLQRYILLHHAPVIPMHVDKVVRGKVKAALSLSRAAVIADAVTSAEPDKSQAPMKTAPPMEVEVEVLPQHPQVGATLPTEGVRDVSSVSASSAVAMSAVQRGWAREVTPGVPATPTSHPDTTLARPPSGDGKEGEDVVGELGGRLKVVTDSKAAEGPPAQHGFMSDMDWAATPLSQHEAWAAAERKKQAKQANKRVRAGTGTSMSSHSSAGQAPRLSVVSTASAATLGSTKHGSTALSLKSAWKGAAGASSKVGGRATG